MSRFPKLFGIVFAIMFIGTIGAMIAGGIWNYRMYQDCRADGHKAYQCQAMLSGEAHYVAVDDVTNN